MSNRDLSRWCVTSGGLAAGAEDGQEWSDETMFRIEIRDWWGLLLTRGRLALTRGVWSDEFVQFPEKYTRAFRLRMGGHRGPHPSWWQVIAGRAPVRAAEHADIRLWEQLP